MLALVLAAALGPALIDPDWTMVALVLFGQAVTLWVALRDGARSAVRRAAASAEAAAKSAAAIEAVTVELGRMATALGELSSKTEEHLIADAAYQARTDSMLEKHEATDATLARILENQQRQLTNVALGIAPAEAMAVPPSRARRGRG